MYVNIRCDRNVMCHTDLMTVTFDVLIEEKNIHLRVNDLVEYEEGWGLISGARI